MLISKPAMPSFQRLNHNPSQTIRPGVAASPSFISADRITFGSSQPTRLETPNLNLVRESIRDFMPSIRSSYLKNLNIQPGTLELLPKPLHRGALTYNYYTHQANQMSAGNVTYVLSGENSTGQREPICAISFRKSDADGQWRFSSLENGPNNLFNTLSRMVEEFPEAEFHLLSGLPGTATSAIEILIVDQPASGDTPASEKVHILGTTNSRFPNTYPEDQYPLKVDTTLTLDEFQSKLTQIGRMNEERTLLQFLWSAANLTSSKARRILTEMIGEEKTDSVLDAAVALKQAPQDQKEAALKELIKTQLSDTPINVAPYLNRATLPGGDED